MEIALHFGANCTDDDRLIRTLLKNGSIMEAEGLKAPGPAKYRKMLRQTIQSMGEGAPNPMARDNLIAAMAEGDACDRLVMSNSNFICVPNRIFENGVFYEQAEIKLAALRDIFREDELDLYLAVRDPATFLPDCYAKANAESVADFLQGVDPLDLRWSDLVARIRATVPEAALTVWCNEDTPMIWDELIWALSGLNIGTEINGGHDLLSTIMTAEGMHRFLAYTNAHPPRTITQKRRVIAAFLDKYALEEELVETVELPGFDASDIAQMSAAYDADLARIAEMPGVRFIGL
ncbi:hypothetical protein EU805_04715 [Salipiger sp. IMCC34102]|uniref:hypothetical protein n=1 Tax=Salipiger sp. IMCC34102 TaxID=2510647 RepID=UPI00101C1F9B|nr:hypothetical protein [Salipiger sp. IMCC34102]RYH03044.1 hypothetical protein EU805_04715 [Salipiger sp. IMCC34102]